MGDKSRGAVVEMETRVLITNIQRYSLHDGPGIRTTVFLKGCSLKCPWCANPENINPYPEEYVKDGKKGIYGYYCTCEEIFDELIKDEIFYHQLDVTDVLGKQCGGVTFSGGEPLLQFDVLIPLLKKLKSEGIHICVETCLFVSEDMLRIALEYVDLFYIDIKILNEETCKNILGGDIKLYLSNLDMLFKLRRSVVFRMPVIGGFTDLEENIEKIIGYLQIYHSLKIELIKEHSLGDNKYTSLGKEAIKLNEVTDEKMDYIKNKISKSTGIPIENCKI